MKPTLQLFFDTGKIVALLLFCTFQFNCKTTSKLPESELIRGIPTYLSPTGFEPDKAIVLKDNDLAFASKIDIIRRAKKQLRLIYYVFKLDESNAYLVNELLTKVKENPAFKVELLTDYHYNYKNLDFFRWLENQQPHGKQQIEVRLYNRPTVNVIKFAEFMTIGCAGAKPDSDNSSLECSKEKSEYLKKYDVMTQAEAEAEMSLEAKLYLSGLYAKDPNGLLFGTQLGYSKTLESMLSGDVSTPNMDAEQKAKLMQVMQLYWTSKTGKNADKIKAKIQLSVLGLFFGKKLKPFLNSMETLLPFSLKDAENEALMNNKDIDYISDYTHHKFILADTDFVQIGGRNCANAYNMHPNELEKKYIFMDTDVYFDLNEAGGQLFQKSFENLWNFTNMVATTTEIENHAPIGYLYMINQATMLGDSLCGADLDQMKRQACIGKIFGEMLANGTDELVVKKQQEWGQQFANYLKAYQEEYLPITNKNKSWTDLTQLFDSKNGFVQNATFSNTLDQVNEIEIKDEQTIYYVENVPFDLRKDQQDKPKKRTYGSQHRKELQYGKMIHKVWEDAFRAACAKGATAENPVEVIIHQGYFAPTEAVVHQLNQLMTENICPNVRVKIYTNSMESTDLTPVNFIGRRQMYALFQKNPNFATDRFEYFEYDKSRLVQEVNDNFPPKDAAKGGGSFSLHSKVMIFDDDIYIGSSNAEFRSYMMDSNNGIFIKDAPLLVAEYKKSLQELEDKKIVIPAKDKMNFADLAALRTQERADIDRLVKHYDKDNRLDNSKRKADYQKSLMIMFRMLDAVSVEMNRSLKKQTLEGASKLDESLKVF